MSAGARLATMSARARLAVWTARARFGIWIASWLAGLAPRERGLVATAAALAVLVAVAGAGLAAKDDLAALRARVAGRERELAEVRRLAAVLGRQPAATPSDAAPLLTRLEAAAADSVGRERIAGMTPTTAATEDGMQEERVALRVSGAALADVVRLLHALEGGPERLPIARLELRKHPDDATRFDATVEVVRVAAPAAGGP